MRHQGRRRESSTWNDIQPELQQAVRDINHSRPFSITRNDVLKSLLLAVGSDTRFDRLVSDRDRVEKLAKLMDTRHRRNERFVQPCTSPS